MIRSIAQRSPIGISLLLLIGTVGCSRKTTESPSEEKKEPAPNQPVVRGGAADDPIIDKWTQQLKSPKAEARLEAATALLKEGQRAAKAIPALIVALKDQDTRVRQYAVFALTYFKPPPREAVRPLADRLNDSDSEIRRTAIWALGKYGAVAEPAVPDMIASLEDDAPNVRGQAIVCLGMIGPPAKAAVPELIQILNDEKKEDLHQSVMLALKDIGPPAREAIPLLRSKFKEDDFLMQVAAAKALQGLSPSPEPDAAAFLELARKRGQVQDVASNYASSNGMIVTWKGKINDDGLLEAVDPSGTTLLVKVVLKRGSLVPRTEAVVCGRLSGDVAKGTDFKFTPDGKKSAVSAIHLTVTNARVVPHWGIVQGKIVH